MEPALQIKRNKRWQSINAQPSVNEKIVEFGRCILIRIPTIASGMETGGRGIYPGHPSPTSSRRDTRFSEENRVKLRRLLKISDKSIMMYDIIKSALTIYAWQCRGSGD